MGRKNLNFISWICSQ